MTVVHSARRRLPFLEAAPLAPIVLVALAVAWLALQASPTTPEAGLPPMTPQVVAPAAKRVPVARLIVIVEPGRIEAVSALVRANEELSDLLAEERRSIIVVQAASPAAAERVAAAARDDFGQFATTEAIIVGELSTAEAPQ